MVSICRQGVNETSFVADRYFWIIEYGLDCETEEPLPPQRAEIYKELVPNATPKISLLFHPF